MDKELNIETNKLVQEIKLWERMKFLRDFENQLAHFEIKLYLLKCKMLDVRKKLRANRNADKRG